LDQDPRNRGAEPASSESHAAERLSMELLRLRPWFVYRTWRRAVKEGQGRVRGLGSLFGVLEGLLTLRGEHLARYRFAREDLDFEGARILDVACGLGYGWRNRRGSGLVVGADLDHSAVREGAAHFGGQDRAFLVANGLHLPFRGSSFDLITCFETLEHVPDPERLLAEIRRVLSTDGVLAISTPNRDATHPGTSRSDRPVNPYHEFELSVEEFRDLLAAFFGETVLYRQKGKAWDQTTGSGAERPRGALGRVVGILDRFRSIGENTEVKPLDAEEQPQYVLAVCHKPRTVPQG